MPAFRVVCVGFGHQRSGPPGRSAGPAQPPAASIMLLTLPLGRRLSYAVPWSTIVECRTQDRAAAGRGGERADELGLARTACGETRPAIQPPAAVTAELVLELPAAGQQRLGDLRGEQGRSGSIVRLSTAWPLVSLQLQ